MRRPTLIDLFCGAGGFSLGFHAAGARVLAAVDADEAAGRTFEANFSRLQRGHRPRIMLGDEGDLEDLALDGITNGESPDILIGGPPCQGFSRLGRAKLDSLTEEGFAGDPRNWLYQRFLDAASHWQPRAVVMENVPGMLSVDGTNIAEAAAADLAGRGYRVGYALLNSAWYGVPQLRERVFFIGIRSDIEAQLSLPPATHRIDAGGGYGNPRSCNLVLPLWPDHELPVPQAHIQLPTTTVSEALDDLPAIRDHLDGTSAPRGDFRVRRTLGKQARSGFARLMRVWPGMTTPRGVVDHVVRRTPRDYETFRRMRPGDRYPEALSIAHARRDEELERLRMRGATIPQSGSPEYEDLERRFVPPYPVEKFMDKWRKLVPDKPSWTVPAHLSKDAYSHIHHDGSQARAISVREAARLQSFPDGFRFVGNMGDCYRQIGNAVPPLLAWALAAELLDCLGHASNRPPVEQSRRSPRPSRSSAPTR
jgi:DNA (cytosine-5)-methyltransferase 1